jgi:hypothetical protein
VGVNEITAIESAIDFSWQAKGKLEGPSLTAMAKPSAYAPSPPSSAPDRFVGCKWSFYPGVKCPQSFPNSSNIYPQIIFDDFHKVGTGT